MADRRPPLPTFRRLEEDPADVARREEQRRRAALDNKLRKLLDDRAGNPQTASRFDLVADALMNVMADRLFAAIHSPDFANELAERGYSVAVLPDGDTPPPPDDWAQDAVDLFGWTGELTDSIGRIDDLWQRAYLAGYAAGEARCDQANLPTASYRGPGGIS